MFHGRNVAVYSCGLGLNMDDVDLVEVLRKLLSPQLDVLVARLKLDTSYLSSSAPPATRAVQILELARQQLSGLAKLESEIERIAPGLLRSSVPATRQSRIVLFFASNPAETPAIDLETELSTIRTSLAAGPDQERWMVRDGGSLSDFASAVLTHRPEIVHIGAHGSPDGNLVVEADDGLRHMSIAAIANVLTASALRVRAIVLNACYSHEQAVKLAPYADFVIGMSREIGDRAALRFAEAFYRALAFDREIRDAFLLALADLDLHALPDIVVPRIIEGTRIEILFPPKRNDSVRSVATTAATTRDVDETLQMRTVWYATTRQPIITDSRIIGYDKITDANDSVHYGRCIVRIPRSHRIGSIGSPWVDRVLSEDDRITIEDLTEEPGATILAQLDQALADDRGIFLFVHGYRVPFDESVRRAAQIACDVKFPGQCSVFSWPSKSRLLSYGGDVAAVEGSEEALADYLSNLVALAGRGRVHVLAHSMGNRGLLRAFDQTIARATAGLPLGQLIFAAPDVERRLFKRLAAKAAARSTRTTLYISGYDYALGGSGFLHEDPRAGYHPPVTIVPQVDTVDAGDVDLSFLGHGYYAAARPVIHDLHALLMNNSDPNSRVGLREARTDTAELYWQMT